MKPTTDHSFPDAEITDWTLTAERLEIEITNVFHDGKLRGPAAIQFQLVRPVSAMSYDHKSEKWNKEEHVERLKDICEFHYKLEKHYSLKGFGINSGKWLAVSVISDNADISWGER